MTTLTRLALQTAERDAEAAARAYRRCEDANALLATERTALDLCKALLNLKKAQARVLYLEVELCREEVEHV